MAQSFVEVVDNRINRFFAKIRKPFRGIINLVTSKGKVQTAQISGLSGETLPSIELFQHFGFSSAPPAGTQAILVPIGGVTTHSVIVATENSQYRIQTLNSGEVAIYNQDGASIVLKQGKIIEANCDTFTINCKTYQVNASDGAKFTTPNLETSEKLTTQGQITGNGGIALQGGSGQIAEFNCDIKQTAGGIDSPSVTVNGIKMGSHKHDTPNGESSPPRN